jgi:two-component system, NarL family, response regulator DesR
MASVTATVSAENGDVGLAPRAAVIDTDARRAQRLGALLGAGGIGTGVEASNADVLVLGCERLGREEREAVSRLREDAPHVALVVVVGRPGPRSARDALAAGADALVLADEAGKSLGPAVRAALSGQVALPRSFGDGFRRPALSRREKQVLGLVVMGLLNAEIATKLHVTESTVKSHLTSCFAKLGVRTRSEATALILDPEGGLGLGVLAISMTGEGDADGG